MPEVFKGPVAVMLAQVGLALLVGFSTSLQPGVNAAFASYAGARVYGGVLNFAVGFIAMVTVTLLLRSPAPDIQRLAIAPWWAWTGGLIGAFFVGLAIVLVRPMGAANYFAAMICGQFVGSMIIDHFGLLGLPMHAFSWGRAMGVGLMGLGVLCIRKF
jgi:transporter family-2 protein